MKAPFFLIFCPLVANAGVLYDLVVQPVDPSNLAPPVAGPAAAAPVNHVFADTGRVRFSGAGAHDVYLFERGILYVIDDPARTVHVLKQATLDAVAAHYSATVAQLQAAAAAAPPEERAAAQRKAADMQQVAQRMLEPVPRTYRVTVKFESVDGRPCRIWEEREHDAKRLELCVASTAAVPGGRDILEGLKTLSRFRQGAEFALGVDFGLSDWWSDFATIGGIPLLIREYKYDAQVAQVTLSAIRSGVAEGSLLDVPADYRTEAGPDYARWVLR